jgi:hypothetical protein
LEEKRLKASNTTDAAPTSYVKISSAMIKSFEAESAGRREENQRMSEASSPRPNQGRLSRHFD